jgi:uncharacterized protein (DUF362 family)
VFRSLLRPLACCCVIAPALAATAVPQAPAPPVSRVYYAADPELMTGFEPNAAAVEAATDDLVEAVTGQRSVGAAWAGLVHPWDHVGIKVSAAGGRDFSTHLPIVEAVLRGLSEAGVPMSQVVIWDRPDPRGVGYGAIADGADVRGIAPFSGYEPKAIFSAPRLGKLIWGDVDFHPRGPDPLARVQMEQYSLGSHWSRLICGLNKIINIPVMSASEDCGIAGCIYNVTLSNVDNWRRFMNPPQFGDPFLAELYSDEHVGPKVVMNIMDGLIAQYGGGPDWQPSYSWRHSTLYAGKDPVAIDATALRVIEPWRKAAKLPPVTDRAKYLETASSMGLGAYEPDQIQLVRVGR